MYCVKGIKAKKRIKYLLDNSLMLVTALAQGSAMTVANIAKAAHKNGTTLKQVIKAGLIKKRL